MNDAYGTKIEVGAYVAYNRSGEVRLGTVKSFSNGFKRDWRTHQPSNEYTFTMVQDKDKKLKPSKITRSVNLVVLDQRWLLLNG